MFCSLVFDIAGVIAIRWPRMGGYKALRRPAVKGLLSSWLITGVVADVLIAVSLVWHLVGRTQYVIPLCVLTQADQRSTAESQDSRKRTQS